MKVFVRTDEKTVRTFILDDVEWCLIRKDSEKFNADGYSYQTLKVSCFNDSGYEQKFDNVLDLEIV